MSEAIVTVESAMMHHAYQLEQWLTNGFDDHEGRQAVKSHTGQLDRLTRALSHLVNGTYARDARVHAIQSASTRVNGE